MWHELKAFLIRGNVLDLAVAVVIAAAFGLVVNSFVDDILMQAIAALGGAPDFSSLAFTVNGTPIRYGAFLNTVINFLIVGTALFFVVKAVSRVRAPKPPASPTETEVDVLKQIRSLLAGQDRFRPQSP